MQNAVSVISQVDGVLCVKTHPNFIDQRCSITAKGIPCVPFYIHIANIWAKTVSLARHVIVASRPIAHT